MSFYKDKNVLVTGGTGLIGRPLVEMLFSSRRKSNRRFVGRSFTRTSRRNFQTC